jgi:hypothetical protein
LDCADPARITIVEEGFEADARPDHVGDPIAVKVDEPNLGIFEIEGRGFGIPFE